MKWTVEKAKEFVRLDEEIESLRNDLRLKQEKRNRDFEIHSFERDSYSRRELEAKAILQALKDAADSDCI